MSLKEPIVEGAYYEREDGQVVGPARPITEDYGHGNYWSWSIGGFAYDTAGRSHQQWSKLSLTRRVYLVPTDPAEVVAELREQSSEANRLSALGYGDAPSYHAGRNEAFDSSADLVAKKLGVE